MPLSDCGVRQCTFTNSRPLDAATKKTKQHSPASNFCPDPVAAFWPSARGQHAVQLPADFRALCLVGLREHVVVLENLPDSPSSSCSRGTHHHHFRLVASHVLDTAVLTFPDRCCQLSSPPVNTSTFSKNSEPRCSFRHTACRCTLCGLSVSRRILSQRACVGDSMWSHKKAS